MDASVLQNGQPVASVQGALGFVVTRGVVTGCGGTLEAAQVELCEELSMRAAIAPAQANVMRLMGAGSVASSLREFRGRCQLGVRPRGGEGPIQGRQCAYGWYFFRITSIITSVVCRHQTRLDFNSKNF